MEYNLRYLWIALGWISVALGVAGAFLPLLPTTPFLLLAAFAFSKGSERLHDWLVNHPKLGPPIQHWRKEQAIARPVKIYASISIVAVFAISVVLQVPWWALASQAVVLTVVSYFLWSRPEPSAASDDGGEPDTVQAE